MRGVKPREAGTPGALFARLPTRALLLAALPLVRMTRLESFCFFFVFFFAFFPFDF